MYICKNSNSATVLSLLLLFLVGACASQSDPNIERGSGYNYEEGLPEMRVSAMGYIDERNQPHLRVSIEVVKGSLIYKSENDSLHGEVDLDIQIISRSNADNIIESERVTKKASGEDDSITNTRDMIRHEFTVDVEPGEYEVVVTAIDRNSQKEITQTATAEIPQIDTGAYMLSSIQMYGKMNSEGTWQPINTYDVKGKMDSLRFEFQIISDRTDEPMTINSALIRFRSDTSYNRPMDSRDYSPSSIEYKGIDYDNPTVIQTSQRKLTDYGSIFIEFKFPQQERGNYRFEVEARKRGDETIFKARDFGIKSLNYPAIQTAKELARPLVYLMKKGEYERLMNISDPDSLKNEVDRFWLRNIGNKSKTRQVIRMYYQRVEEANKQFSNFKEGWKTDTGMIYILFGPPWYVERHVDQMQWFYSYNRQDPEYTYSFFQPKMRNRYYPFYHYVLRRNNAYYQIQYRQRNLWLNGLILTRQL